MWVTARSRALLFWASGCGVGDDDDDGRDDATVCCY